MWKPRSYASEASAPMPAKASWWGRTRSGLAAVGRFQWKATKVMVAGSALAMGGSWALVKGYYHFGLDDGSHPGLSSVVHVIEGQNRGSKLMLSLAGIYLSSEASRLYLEKWEGLSEEEVDQRMKLKHQKNAEKLLVTITELSGVYVKLGQEVSMMRGILPDEYCDTFSVLQDQVPHVPFEDIEKVFVRDVGAPVEELFLEFEKTPFAAASLAQVHRAKLLDGTDVAVKVQYPTVGKHLDGDLSSNRVASKVVAMLNDNFKYDEELSKNMEAHLVSELDFVHEAKNARRCANNFADDGRLYVPEVFDQLTSKNVMTMEFIDGVKANDIESMKRMGISTKEVGTIIFDTLSRQVFEHGFVHADPHPGNVFVRAIKDEKGMKKTQVVLLDHGLYTEIDDTFRKQYATLWKDLVTRDMEGFNKTGLAMGIRHPDLFAKVLLMQSLDSLDIGGEGGMVQDHMQEPPEGGNVGGAKAKKNGFGDMDEEEMEKWRDLMQNLPKQIHFLLRALFIQRALNQGLGAPVNRFSVMASVAAKNSLDAVLSGEDKSYSAALRRSWFQTKLVFVDYAAWTVSIFANLYMAVLGR